MITMMIIIMTMIIIIIIRIVMTWIITTQKHVGVDRRLALLGNKVKLNLTQRHAEQTKL